MNPKSIFLACFFLSGAAGLIYQVVWVRMFTLVFGNTVYAASMVVAAFLAGLALGSRYWGARIDKIRDPIKTYVKLELMIALSAVLVTCLIQLVDGAIVSLMDVESIGSGKWQFIRFVILFILLLAPTSLMGGTVPVMARVYITTYDNLGKGLSALYAANTYGAVVGCFVTGFLLISSFGVFGAFTIALLLNLAVAGLVAWIPKIPETANKAPKIKSTPRQKSKRKKELRVEPSISEKVTAYQPDPGLILLLALLSGFSALAFEIMWTRAFVVSFKSTVYLFSNLLAVFLLGMAIGSHILTKWLDRLKDPVHLFGLAQVGIGVWGVISVISFIGAPGWALSMTSIFGEMNLSKDALIQLILMATIFGPATVLMGMSFPLLCKVYTGSIESLGTQAGKVYAVGTVGGIVGSLAAGFFLLPSLGLQNGLFVISVITLLTGFLAMFVSASRRGAMWVYTVSTVVTLAVIVSMQITGVNIGLGVAVGEEIVFAKEEVMGSVKVTRKNSNLTLHVNNYQLATSGDVAVRFGHIPMLLHPEAKDALVISLGAGITSGSVGRHPLDRIECVEIVPSLLDVHPLFAKDNHNIIADERFHLTFWDGRHYVRASKRKYDLVISDLFQPDSAGVGSLYALEFFLDVKSKLKKGGAMAQWLPMYQLSPENLKVVMKTFATAFEYTLVFSGDLNSELPTIMLYGSADPIRISPDKLLARLEAPGVKEDMIENTDPLSFLSFYVMDRDGILDFTQGSPVNTDNRPVVEFTAPKYLWDRKMNAVNNFTEIKKRRKQLNARLLGTEEDETINKAIERYYHGRTFLLQGKIEHAKRNYPEELKLYKEAYKLVPGDPFLGLAVFDLGYLYYHRQDFATAVKFFEWVKKINYNLLEAHFYLAKSYQFLGQKQKSVEAFSELAKLKPEIAEGLLTEQ